MLKKTLLLSALFSLSSGMLSAIGFYPMRGQVRGQDVAVRDKPDSSDYQQKKRTGFDLLVEGKVGCFKPTGSQFSHLYSNALSPGLELTVGAWHSFYGWTSVNYISRSGSTSDFHSRSLLDLVPIAFGVKYFIPIKRVDLYVGGGAQYSYLHVKDTSSHVVQSSSKWGWGGIVNGGVIVNLQKHVFVDFFGNYSFLEIDFNKGKHGAVSRHTANCSGWTVGIGFGYRL